MVSLSLHTYDSDILISVSLSLSLSHTHTHTHIFFSLVLILCKKRPGMDKFQSSSEEDKWREDMRIRINEATDLDAALFTEISKPPKALVDVKPQSYRPQILTIGPLHEILSGSPVLYDCKALCVNKFMRAHNISDVDELMKCLFYDPSDLHIHYSGLPNYSSESLQLLVTMDTIFIREFLLFIPTEWDSILEEHTQFCKICNNNIAFKQVLGDLFLMGNQIPVSYLKKLIDEFPKNSELEWDELQEGLNYAVAIIDPFFISKGLSLQEMGYIFETPEFVSCNHLLDFLYVWVLRERSQMSGSKPTKPWRFPRLRDLFETKQEPRKKTIFGDRLPTVSQLSKAGIGFRAIEGAISVMNYNKRKLRLDLPRLIVKDRTEDMLRNLLAYEQTSKANSEFTKYVSIMDSLIDTPEDVAILTKAQVIENHLGSDEKLLKMWNDMCTNIDIRPCERWDEMIRDVLDDYENPDHAMYAEFREKYLSRPWLAISLLVGFLLLLMSILQTGYGIAAYYQS